MKITVSVYFRGIKVPECRSRIVLINANVSDSNEATHLKDTHRVLWRNLKDLSKTGPVTREKQLSDEEGNKDSGLQKCDLLS